jgi:hypothetical protein
MNAELQRVWKDVVVGFLSYNPGIYLKRLQKTRKHFRHDSQWSGWKANQASLENNSTAYRLQQGPEWLSRYTDSLQAGRPGIRIVVGRDIPLQPRPIPGPTQHPVQRLPGLFPGGGGKAAEAWRWTPTPI